MEIRHLLGITVIGSVLALTHARAQATPLPPVVYNPNIEQADDPTPLVLSALNFLISGEDDQLFINHISRGQKAAFDEFADASDNDNKIREENRQALREAKAILNGEVDLPYATYIQLLRYNPANKSFITECASEGKKFNWYPTQTFEIDTPTARKIGAVLMLNANQVEALEMPPAIAKQLAERTNGERRLVWQMKFRLVKDRLQNGGHGDAGMVIGGLITEVGFTYKDHTRLEPEIAAAIQPHPYVRTEAEQTLSTKLKFALLAGDRTIMFLNGGACMYSMRDLRSDADAIWLNDQPVIPWYILGTKILFITPKGELLQSYTLEGDKLSIEGVPYKPARFRHEKETNRLFFPEELSQRIPL